VKKPRERACNSNSEEWLPLIGLACHVTISLLLRNVQLPAILFELLHCECGWLLQRRLEWWGPFCEQITAAIYWKSPRTSFSSEAHYVLWRDFSFVAANVCYIKEDSHKSRYFYLRLSCGILCTPLFSCGYRRDMLTKCAIMLFCVKYLAWFGLLTAVVMKSSVLGMPPCSPLKVSRYFGGTSHATCFYSGFLLMLFFDPEDGGDIFLLNVGWLSTDYTVLYPTRYNSSSMSPVPKISRFKNTDASYWLWDITE
jgi:hypothetical protein